MILGGRAIRMPRMAISLILPLFLLASCAVATAAEGPATRPFDSYVLEVNTPPDPALQAKLEAIDAAVREPLGMKSEDAAAGLLDLVHLKLAMIHPDREEYAASVPKVGILLAYFATHADAATALDPTTRHELGLMVKVSNNEMASKFSHEIGLKKIQEVLDSY